MNREKLIADVAFEVAKWNPYLIEFTKNKQIKIPKNISYDYVVIAMHERGKRELQDIGLQTYSVGGMFCLYSWPHSPLNEQPRLIMKINSEKWAVPPGEARLSDIPSSYLELFLFSLTATEEELLTPLT